LAAISLQVVKRAGNSYYLIGILAVGLAAVIGVGVICVICAVIKMRKRATSSGKGRIFDVRQKRPILLSGANMILNFVGKQIQTLFKIG
jgi:hypothetical protein